MGLIFGSWLHTVEHLHAYQSGGLVFFGNANKLRSKEIPRRKKYTTLYRFLFIDDEIIPVFGVKIQKGNIWLGYKNKYTRFQFIVSQPQIDASLTAM